MHDNEAGFWASCTAVSCIVSAITWFFDLLGHNAQGILVFIAICSFYMNWYYQRRRDKREQKEFDGVDRRKSSPSKNEDI